MIENKHQSITDFWFQETDIYKYKTNSNVEKFSIDTPPPTVSGSLHIGHVFSYCHTDFIARFQRIMGKNIFYPIGFDNNGLPTERLIEKTKKINAKKMHSENKIQDFIEICKTEVVQYQDQFKSVFQALGISYDWSLQYETISDKTKTIAQSRFNLLNDHGFIYKKKSPVYWDCIDRTATAQAEIEDKEKTGKQILLHFKDHNKNTVQVMTTRPEMLSACVAVLCHPEDERFQYLKGQSITTPLFNIKVPIIFDEDVKMDKGTGIVMCCTYGDWQDVVWFSRHQKQYNLQSIDLITDYGTINYCEKKLKIKDAQNTIIADLVDQNLASNLTEITHAVKCAERSGGSIEIIEKEQWYIKVLEHKETLLEIVNKLNFHPNHMKIKLINWVNGINQDWCISRDRFFGVEVPSDPTKVLDTWFTSALTRSLALTDNQELHTFDLRAQSHEILRTWAFYTIVQEFYINKINKTEQKLPWNNIMLSGWCLAPDKTKMSKSKGNVIDPIKLINQHDVDSIRYWSGSSHLGNDTVFSEEQVKIGKKLITKITNVCKFVEIISKNISQEILNEKCKLNINDLVENKTISYITDLAILSKFTSVISSYQEYFNQFEYSKAKEVVEKFFWSDFCDNYIEIVKKRAYNDENDSNNIENQISAIITLVKIAYTSLILFGPFLAYNTEKLYQEHFKSIFLSRSIHETGILKDNLFSVHNDNALLQLDKMYEIVAKIRYYKSENKIALNAQMNSVIIPKSYNIDQQITNDLKLALNIKNIEFQDINDICFIMN